MSHTLVLAASSLSSVAEGSSVGTQVKHHQLGVQRHTLTTLTTLTITLELRARLQGVRLLLLLHFLLLFSRMSITTGAAILEVVESRCRRNIGAMFLSGRGGGGGGGGGGVTGLGDGQ